MTAPETWSQKSESSILCEHFLITKIVPVPKQIPKNAIFREAQYFCICQELHKYFRKCEQPALGFGISTSTAPAAAPAAATAPAAAATAPAAPAAAPAPAAPPAVPVAPAAQGMVGAAPMVASPMVATAAPVYPNFGPGYGLGIGAQPVYGQVAGAWGTPK